MNTNQVKTEIYNQLPYLTKKYHVKKLGVFGSMARNEARKESDVDVLVEFKSPIGFFDFIRLENYLTKTLGRKVDLVTKKALKPTIKDDILNDIVYV